MPRTLNPSAPRQGQPSLRPACPGGAGLKMQVRHFRRPGSRNRPTPDKANGWMDGDLTEGGPSSCRPSWALRRDLDKSQVVVVELWEDLHGPKRLEVCMWAQFRGLCGQPNTKDTRARQLRDGSIDQKESLNKKKSACHQRSVNKKTLPVHRLLEITAWLSLGLELGERCRCTASGPSQTCASGRRLMGEANPCLASWDAPLLPQSPGFLS